MDLAVPQYCFDLASPQSSIQKSCQNAAENSERNCETTAAASSTEKTANMGEGVSKIKKELPTLFMDGPL